MKPGRQEVILEIITQQDIETQFQLLQALEQHGIKSTQATLSRDIKDMHLIKEAGPDGRYRYAQAAKNEAEDFQQRLKKILREGVQTYAVAQNLMVIKTLPGLAPAVCSALDGMNIDCLVGSIAGDDTAFLAMADNNAALKLYHEIEVIFDR